MQLNLRKEKGLTIENVRTIIQLGINYGEKLASIKDIIKVDSKPTISNNIITYVKNGTSHTTTDSETWFYYVVDGELYKTIFIDGEEFTKADSNVNLEGYVEEDNIVTTLDGTVTDEQIPSAKLVKEKLNEVFQYSNDAQNEYETAIIGKGGTVSKVGDVATKSEIVSGIESISEGDIEVIHDVMTNLGYTATNLTNTDAEKTAHILSKWFKLKTATNNVDTILNASNTSSTFTNWMIDSEITDFGNYINPNYTTTQLTLSQDTTTDMFISENLTVHELYTINEGEVN